MIGRFSFNNFNLLHQAGDMVLSGSNNIYCIDDRKSRRGSHLFRQRGMTLVEFMTGMTIGLLVVLAAIGSLIMTRMSVHTMIDSAELEQQAALVMMLIGQQIKGTGFVNAYPAGTDPSATNALATGGADGIIFDTRPTGIAMNGVTPISIMGVDGGRTAPDAFAIAYAIPNDGAPASNCIGTASKPLPNPRGAAAERVVSIFSVNTTTHDLLCGSDTATQPVASNVMDMQILYLSINAAGNVIWQTATQVGTSNLNIKANGGTTIAQTLPSVNWANVNGLLICLHMQGEASQAPAQTFTDCQGNKITIQDGRIHRIIRQTFYLRNTAHSAI